jgi:hypothetical protein
VIHGEVIETEARVILDAADAAVTWWRGRKPIGWGIAKHLANPTINCPTYREKLLARRAARWYAVCHPKKVTADTSEAKHDAK